MARRGLRALARAVVPREDWILIVSLAVVAAALVFVLLAGQVAAGRTQTFDELILTGLRRPEDPSVPIGPGWLESAALDLTALGSAAVLILLVVATLGYLMLARHWALVALTL